MEEESDLDWLEQKEEESNLEYPVYCVRCSQRISNPICEKCYFKHLEMWLKEHNIQSHIKIKILQNIKGINTKENLNETKCVICEKNTLSFCTYCYFFNIECILSKSGVEREIIKDFRHSFNYDIYHYDYSPL